jgi:hypothetical protein
MEEAPENGKESSHSAQSNGIEWNSKLRITEIVDTESADTGAHLSINKVYWSNISLLLCKTKINFCVHTSKLFSPILSHYKPAHIFTPYFSKVQYYILFK